jgi:hypothetical protein
MVTPIEMLLHSAKTGGLPADRKPEACFVESPGLSQVPKPGGRIEGGVSFGEYKRTHTWSEFISIVVPQ